MMQNYLMGLGDAKAENICIDVGNRSIAQILVSDKPQTEEEKFKSAQAKLKFKKSKRLGNPSRFDKFTQKKEAIDEFP